MCLGSRTVTRGCETLGSTGSQNFDFLSLNLELAQSGFTLGGYVCVFWRRGGRIVFGWFCFSFVEETQQGSRNRVIKKQNKKVA